MTGCACRHQPAGRQLPEPGGRTGCSPPPACVPAAPLRHGSRRRRFAQSLGGAPRLPECAAAQQSRPTTRLAHREGGRRSAPWPGCPGRAPGTALPCIEIAASATIGGHSDAADHLQTPQQPTPQTHSTRARQRTPQPGGHACDHGGFSLASTPPDSPGADKAAPHASSRRPGPHWSEHTYGGPSGRRCGTLLLYPLFELFDLGF